MYSIPQLFLHFKSYHFIFRKGALNVNYPLVSTSAKSQHKGALRQNKPAVHQHIQNLEQLPHILLTLRLFQKLLKGPPAVAHEVVAPLL